MRINVPANARKNFWKEAPEGFPKFWLFRTKPACEIGEELVFYFDGRPVARAIVSGIEPPGLDFSFSPEEFLDHWKVYWHQKSFRSIEVQPVSGKPETKRAASTSRVIAVTELREFVFCPRSWKLRRQGGKPPSEAAIQKKKMVEEGNRFHRDHAQEAYRASYQAIQPQMGKGRLVAVGWALMILGVLVCLYSLRF